MHCLCWLSRDSSWWHCVVAVILGSAGQSDVWSECDAACKGEMLLGPNFWMTIPLGKPFIFAEETPVAIFHTLTSEIWDPGGCDGPWGHKEDNSFQHWRGFRNFWWCLFCLFMFHLAPSLRPFLFITRDYLFCLVQITFTTGEKC